MIPSVKVAATAPPSRLTESSQAPFQQRDHICRPAHDIDPGMLECSQLFLGSPGGARDDGAGVSHPAALGCRLAGNEADDRFGYPFLDKGCSALLVGAADLPDHHDSLGSGIVLECLETIDEIGTDDRVSPDPDAGALAD